jgi:Subtilase family
MRSILFTGLLSLVPLLSFTPSRSAAASIHVVMLRGSGAGAAMPARRIAFAARAGGLGAVVRDTLSAAGPAWAGRVLRVSVPDALALRALTADPDVAWIEPDFERAIVTTGVDSLPNDPLLRDSRQWGLYNVGPAGAYGGVARADVHAPEAWTLTGPRTTGERSPGATAAYAGAPPPGARDVPIRLGLADTGIDPAHPEFADAFGATRVVDAVSLADPSIGVYDSIGHGTMVAGVMAAAVGDGAHFDSLGMAGMCGSCEIVPARITRGAQRTASSFDIAAAMLYATEHGARAMNLSFAGGGRSRVERLALEYAITHRCVVVAASGNKGFIEPQVDMYPARYAADGLCLAVGASDPADHRAAFSSYGPHLDLVAPGLDIWSTWMTYPANTGQTYPGYVAGSGTSFAAPFVTGTLGLIARTRPELMDRDLQHLLRMTADDVGAPGQDDQTGAGRLNAASALAAVQDVGIWHEEAAATEWHEVGADTLWLGEDGPGTFVRAVNGLPAVLVEFSARVALPDSFESGAIAWPRVGGTSTIRRGTRLAYHVPWCEATIEDERAIVLRGWGCRIQFDSARAAGPADRGARLPRASVARTTAFAGAGRAAGIEVPPEDFWIPLPPDQMRFGFTVIGRVRRAADAEPVSARASVLRASPNPSRGPVRIDLPARGSVTVLDLMGRVVWRAGRRDDAGAVTWPGTDVAGREVAPGLYFVRFSAARGEGRTLVRRIVRLR